MITWFSLPGLGYPEGVMVGACIVALLMGAVVLHRRGEERGMRIALVAVGVVYVLVLAGSGPAFVSGAFVACPVAVAAFWRSRPASPTILVIAVALTATIVTWLFQYLGGAGPQWGGRYILAPTLMLTAVGAVHLDDVPPVLRRAVVGFAGAVSLFGVVWLAERSHDVDRFFAELADRPEEVVISTNGFLVREAGPAYEDRLYLSLGRGTSLSGAVDVVDESGRTTFGVLATTEDLPDIDATERSVERVELLGVPLWYHSYSLD